MTTVTRRVRLRPRGPLYSSNLIDLVGRPVMWALRRLNPRARVWVDVHPLHLGSSFRAEWAFRPGLTPLRNVRVTLEGAELSVDTYGEDSYTDRYGFSTGVIYEGRFEEARQGSGSAAVPLPTMPSYRCGNEQIEWSIHVATTADAPWPPTDDYFVVKVLPDALR